MLSLKIIFIKENFNASNRSEKRQIYAYPRLTILNDQKIQIKESENN